MSGKVLDRFRLDGKEAVVTGGSRGLGCAIGLVIRRFGGTGSYIIPGDRVAARIADLRLGKAAPIGPVDGLDDLGPRPPQETLRASAKA